MRQALEGLYRFTGRYWPYVAGGLLGLQVAVLAAMGRPWICKCGQVKLFEDGILNGQTSQHIADWYTPSHIIHGFLFYLFAWVVAREWPVGARLVIAIVLEAAWEVFENTPMVVERYRDATAAVDYRGDSILNSGFDTVWMMLGFAIALKLPVKWVVVLAVGFELLAGWVVRDNLSLQILTFLWPIDAVVDWQSRV